MNTLSMKLLERTILVVLVHAASQYTVLVYTVSMGKQRDWLWHKIFATLDISQITARELIGTGVYMYMYH